MNLAIDTPGLFQTFPATSFTLTRQEDNLCQSLDSNTLTITRRQILDWSKLKQSADDNFKSDENSRKFSKRVENTVGKGETASYEQFLLFPQCFQNACF